jgi:soluble lytic murein transglycosylase-like protein
MSEVVPFQAMRVTGVLLAVVLAAPTAYAQVQLVIKRDGSKIIYNVPTGHEKGHKPSSDFQWLARQHDRPSRYDLLIEKYAKKFRVDATLVRAVIQVESDFDPMCVSRKGARGLMQLMPETAKKYGVTQVHDPDQNIRAGILHLREMLEMFSDLPRALAAYNAGPNAVLKYDGIPPYRETTEYVKRALTVYYGHPFGQPVIFAAGKGKPVLGGGFSSRITQPIAAIVPGMRYLGSQ